MSEINNFASYWQELIDHFYILSELESQNEKLEKQNEELLAINKKVLYENERLKKKLRRLEETIQTLSNSEATLKLAQDKLNQAEKISDEAKIKIRQMEHLKSIAENLINDYYQKTMELQGKLNAMNKKGEGISE